MVKRIIAIAIIFFCTSVFWIILGIVNSSRTSESRNKLSKEVESLWGDILYEKEPSFYMVSYANETYEEKDEHGIIRYITKKKENEDPMIPIKSDIKTDLKLDYRKKGLKWFSTYNIKFNSYYVIIPTKKNIEKIRVVYKFPSEKSIFDDFKLIINNEEIKNLKINENNENNNRAYSQNNYGAIICDIPYKDQIEFKIDISYVSRGLDEWKYSFGNTVRQIKDFNLEVATDFKKIDFPSDCISPTDKLELKGGWKLTWKYSNLLSGYNIGVKMPQKLQPGEIASRISFFAPISLLFFFVFIFFICLILNVKLHPMHYFFIAASFFSFHLFFSYTIDHMNIFLSFIFASMISLFLVGFYLKIIHGLRFTIIYILIPQFVYLILFTFSNFFEGYTGLTVTIASIITLFILMKLTANIDWEKKSKV